MSGIDSIIDGMDDIPDLSDLGLDFELESALAGQDVDFLWPSGDGFGINTSSADFNFKNICASVPIDVSSEDAPIEIDDFKVVWADHVEEKTIFHADNLNTYKKENLSDPVVISVESSEQPSKMATIVIYKRKTAEDVDDETSSSPIPAKRNRLASESSGSESGGAHPSPSSSASSSPKSGAPVQLSSEERALMLREGVRVPTHYPLSREEQRVLTRIRRKIRNKASAQDSRKRRKAYLHDMEERVERCSLENDELKSKVSRLERQNQTLVDQLKRLRQVVMSAAGATVDAVKGSISFGESSEDSSFRSKKSTSAALMMVLLSAALFLVPGMNDEVTGNKANADLMQVLKKVPLPGQSRSLLQAFEANDILRALDTDLTELDMSVSEALARSEPSQIISSTDTSDTNSTDSNDVVNNSTHDQRKDQQNINLSYSI